MKLNLFLLLFLVTTTCFAQPYNDDDILLVTNRPSSLFIILKNDTAYYDYWGGKKYMTYFFMDTMIKSKDGRYTSSIHSLEKQIEGWILKTDSNNYTINFKKADSASYSNWVHNINSLRYGDVGNEIQKYESINRKLYNYMSEHHYKLFLNNLPDNISLNDYKQLQDSFLAQYIEYLPSIPLYNFRPHSYRQKFHRPKKEGKK